MDKFGYKVKQIIFEDKANQCAKVIYLILKKTLRSPKKFVDQALKHMEEDDNIYFN